MTDSQRHFHEELSQLKQRLLAVSSEAEDAVGHAVDALLRRDAARAQAVIHGDRAIDALESGIEELIVTLKRDYTIVIVTHNMQQAARVSDHTGFFYLGQLVEFGRTQQIFTSPRDPRTEAYITGRFG